MRISEPGGEKPVKKIDEKRARKAKLEQLRHDSSQSKRPNEALERCEEEKALVFGSMLEHAVYRGTDMRVLWANKAACESVGLSPEQLAGRYCYEIWHQRSKPCLVCPAKEALKSGKREEMEVATPDGRIWFIRAYPIKNANGEVIGIANTTLEVTERKKAEEALRASHDYLVRLTNSMWDAVFSVKMPGRIIEWVNDSFRLIGYEPEDCIGKTTEFLYPDKREFIDFGNKLKKSIEAGEDVLHAEQLLRRKNGEIFPAEITTTIFREKGQVTRVTSIVRDITERKKVEEALRRSEKQASAAIEAARALTFNYDIATGNVNWGGAIEEITGYTPEEFAQIDVDGWAERLHPDDKDRVLSILQEVIQEKERATAEYRFRTKKGYVTLSSISLTERENGKAVRLVGILQDITERKRAEEALKESEKRFRIASQTASDVVYERDLQTGIATFYGDIDSHLGYEPGGYPRTWEGWREHVHPEDLAWIESKSVDQLESGIPHGIEYRMRKKDGTYMTWLDRVMVIRDEETGKPLKFIGAATDITERKKVEEALRHSEEKYKTVVESSLDAIFVHDHDGRYLFINEAGARYYGKKPSEVFGKSLAELLPKEDAESMLKDVHRVYREKRALKSEYAVPFGGKTRLFATILSPVFDEHRNIISVLGMGRDITGQKQMEEALRENEKQASAAIEAARALTFNYDIATGNVNWGGAIEEITGYTPEEFAQIDVDGWAERLHPDDKDRVLSILQEVIQEKERATAEYRFRTKKGYVTLSSISLTERENGKAVRLVGILQDITERKRAEDALAQKRNLIRALMDNIPDYIYFKDRQSRFIRTSKAHAKMFGLNDPVEAIGKTDFDFFSNEHAHQAYEDEQEIIRTGQPLLNIEERETWHNRSDTWVLTSKMPLCDEEGKIIGTFGISRDITERKRAEKQYRTIVRTAMDGFWIVDKQGHFLDVNDAYCMLIGYSRDELLTMCIPDVEAMEKPEVTAARIKKIIEVGEDRFETCHKRKDGRIVDVEVSANYMKDEEQFFVFLRDITERKRAEQLIRKERDKTQKYLDVAAVIIVAIDAEQRIGLINKKGCDILGYSEDEVLGKNWFDNFLPERIRGNVREIFNKILCGEADRSKYHENPVLTRNGDERLIAWHNTILRNNQGEVIATLSSGQDITERRQAEEQITKLAKFPAEDPNPVLRISGYGTVIYGNKASQPLLEAWSCHVGHSVPENWHEYVLDALSGGQDQQTEVECDGRIFALIFAPIVDTNYVNVYGHDITEHKKAEQKLREDQVRLKSLASELTLAEERERRRIATELHDQIGQSLVISKIKLEALRGSGFGSEVDVELSEVCNTLGQTIANTRSLTFDLSSPILYELGFAKAVEEYIREHVEKKHRIQTTFEDDGMPKPLDDNIRVLLFRDVRELLVNVVKHANADKVKVSISRIGDQVCVSVEDNGVGFDVDEAASRAVSEGAFGLFSIRERLEELGGRLEIKSELGRGSKITMKAPLIKERTDSGRE